MIKRLFIGENKNTYKQQNACRCLLKESTGFEPARRITGSPDFESGALPLCQLSEITNVIITINKSNDNSYFIVSGIFYLFS